MVYHGCSCCPIEFDDDDDAVVVVVVAVLICGSPFFELDDVGNEIRCDAASFSVTSVSRFVFLDVVLWTFLVLMGLGLSTTLVIDLPLSSLLLLVPPSSSLLPLSSSLDDVSLFRPMFLVLVRFFDMDVVVVVVVDTSLEIFFTSGSTFLLLLAIRVVTAMLMILLVEDVALRLLDVDVDGDMDEEEFNFGVIPTLRSGTTGGRCRGRVPKPEANPTTL
jgi:hypothetical protein